MKYLRYCSIPRRAFLPVCAAVIVAMTIACGSEPAPAPTATPAATAPAANLPASPASRPLATMSPQATATSTPGAATEATPEPALEPTAIPYDSNSAMYKVFPGFGRTSNRTYDALEEVRANSDKSMVAVLIESMRYQSTPNAREATADVLRELTGAEYGGEDWKQWMEWLGRHKDEYPPPAEYLDWKINYLSQVHPRFAAFLYPARDGAITVDPTEIAWGGVLPDGIPDIRSPKMLTPDEADFLYEDDRVFGVSINGDTRAYPLRIINAHEMVNDTVGGEPISLAW